MKLWLKPLPAYRVYKQKCMKVAYMLIDGLVMITLLHGIFKHIIITFAFILLP